MAAVAGQGNHATDNPKTESDLFCFFRGIMVMECHKCFSILTTNANVFFALITFENCLLSRRKTHFVCAYIEGVAPFPSLRAFHSTAWRSRDPSGIPSHCIEIFWGFQRHFASLPVSRTCLLVSFHPFYLEGIIRKGDAQYSQNMCGHFVLFMSCEFSNFENSAIYAFFTSARETFFHLASMSFVRFRDHGEKIQNTFTKWCFCHFLKFRLGTWPHNQFFTFNPIKCKFGVQYSE